METQKKLEITYGYKPFGLFRQEFKIEDNQLYFRNRHINWADIARVNVREGLLYYFFGFFFYGTMYNSQRTILTLKDGTKIHIKCDLSREGAKIKLRITELSDEYKELRDWVIMHVSKEKVRYPLLKLSKRGYIKK